MKKYYYLDANNQQQGPFTVQELDQYGVNPQTLVWFQGAADWQPAGQIQEIYDYFMSVIPPEASPQAPEQTGYPQNTQAQMQQQALYRKQSKNDKVVRWVLACIFGIISLFALVGLINSGDPAALVFFIAFGALVPVSLFVGRKKDPNMNTDGVMTGTMMGMGMASQDNYDDGGYDDVGGDFD